MSNLGCLHKRFDGLLSSKSICRSIRLSIKLYTIGSRLCSILNHFRFSTHKHRCPDSFFLEFPYNLPQKRKVFLRIPPCIRCNLTGSIRHQCNLSRTYLQYKLIKLTYRIAFYIKFSLQNRLQVIYILIADMTFIRTRMYRNPLSAEPLAIQSHFYDIGVVTSPCITQCSYFINIYT